jgi:hypothetical protein
MADNIGFKVTPATVGFVLSLITLVTTLVGVISYVKSLEPANSPIVREMQLKNADQDRRLDRTDEDRINNTAALKDQTAETQKLKEAVVRLTTVMEQSVITKKAENTYPFAYPSASRASAEFEVR